MSLAQLWSRSQSFDMIWKITSVEYYHLKYHFIGRLIHSNQK